MTSTPKTEIYTTLFCPYCAQAKHFLETKQATYKEIDVTASSKLRQEMTARAGGRSSVPQIFIDDQHIGGCNDLLALERDGKLDQLLQATS